MKAKVIKGVCRETSGLIKQKLGLVLGIQALFISGKRDEIMGRVDQYMARAAY